MRGQTVTLVEVTGIGLRRCEVEVEAYGADRVLHRVGYDLWARKHDPGGDLLSS